MFFFVTSINRTRWKTDFLPSRFVLLLFNGQRYVVKNIPDEELRTDDYRFLLSCSQKLTALLLGADLFALRTRSSKIVKQWWIAFGFRGPASQ
jgi:hypothetical protein